MEDREKIVRLSADGDGPLAYGADDLYGMRWLEDHVPEWTRDEGGKSGDDEPDWMSETLYQTQSGNVESISLRLDLLPPSAWGETPKVSLHGTAGVNDWGDAPIPLSIEEMSPAEAIVVPIGVLLDRACGGDFCDVLRRSRLHSLPSRLPQLAESWGLELGETQEMGKAQRKARNKAIHDIRHHIGQHEFAISARMRPVGGADDQWRDVLADVSVAGAYVLSVDGAGDILPPPVTDAREAGIETLPDRWDGLGE